VRRRTYYDLHGKEKRLHLLKGLAAILLDIDKAIKIIRTTEEETEEYIAKTAEKLGAKAEELKQYFGVDFIAEEQKKEMASNIIFDTAIITEAAPEEKAEEKAEETEKEAE